MFLVTVKAIFQLALGLAWFWLSLIGGLFFIDSEVIAVCILLGIFMTVASAIWSFIECVLLLCGVKNTDGKGKELRD